MIESRGDGGYGIFWPMVGCEVVQGDPLIPPTVTLQERDLLIEIACEFNEGMEFLHAAHAAAVRRAGRSSRHDGGTRPGDAYNERACLADVGALLRKAGATVRTWSTGVGATITRPGKDPRDGSSGDIRVLNGVPILVQFSTSWPIFEPGRGYAPFQIYAALEHGSDWTRAASALATQGYGGW